MYLCTKCNSLQLGTECLMKHLKKCLSESMNIDEINVHDLENELLVSFFFSWILLLMVESIYYDHYPWCD